MRECGSDRAQVSETGEDPKDQISSVTRERTALRHSQQITSHLMMLASPFAAVASQRRAPARAGPKLSSSFVRTTGPKKARRMNRGWWICSQGVNA